MTRENFIVWKPELEAKNITPPPAARQAAQAAVEMLSDSFDPDWGGFGNAPKFPQAPVLELLLRIHALDSELGPAVEPMLRKTLDTMRAGGIYDQIGGGFARYSVDKEWLIPHFEKMLYDNALLARIYLRAGQALGNPGYAATATEILDYLADEMRDDAGGLHAAEDADSEGAEGKYYVWSHDEFFELAGKDADIVAPLYGITQQGNFEGANNLYLAVSPRELAKSLELPAGDIEAAKARVDAALISARQRRIRPGRDTKVIAAWNGLAIRAFAEAAAVLEAGDYRDVAIGIAEFVTTEMIDTSGRLHRAWRQGRTSGPGFCDDYAAMAVGLYTLFSVTGDVRWYDHAEVLTTSMIDLFGDTGGFFSPGSDAAGLIARPKDFTDNPLPSANSLAAEALLLRSAYGGVPDEHAAEIARGAGRLLERYPSGVGHLLSVLLTAEFGIREVAIVGDGPARRELERVAWEGFRPECVVAVGPVDSPIPLLHGRGTAEAGAAAHVCRNFVCDLPVSTAEELRSRLRR